MKAPHRSRPEQSPPTPVRMDASSRRNRLPKGARPCGSEASDACSAYGLRLVLSGLALAGAVVVATLCVVAWAVAGPGPISTAGLLLAVVVASIAVLDSIVIRRRMRERAGLWVR